MPEQFETKPETDREQMRERLKDVYGRLRRNKIKESGSYFMSDLRISEDRLAENEITEAQFYEDERAHASVRHRVVAERGFEIYQTERKPRRVSVCGPVRQLADGTAFLD